MLSSSVGQWIGLQFGEFLGRQIALGACRDDGDDDVERRPFVPRLASHELPPAVDLRGWMTAVEDQGALGSCTANALAGALEYLIRRERGASVDVSRLFIYFNQRLWDDRVREDTGASIAGGIRALSRIGAPSELSWPYQRDLFAVQPTAPVYAEAATFRAVDWWSLPVDGDALRGCLAAGFPVVFGTRVTESFVKTPPSGLCGMPAGLDDRRHGRHALCLVGYHDAERTFIVRNSWGADWGDRGYVYMPYAYVLEKSWTQSCWAIRLTTRAAFDPAEHGGATPGVVPRAPPVGGASAGIVGTVANVGAQIAVGALTGSSLLAGLAGGLVAGVTPGAMRVLGGRDRGAYVDRDRSEEILALLRGGGAPPPALAPMPWDDGLDEEAVRAAGARVDEPRVPVPVPGAAPIPVSTPAAQRVPTPTPNPALPVATDFVAQLPARVAEAWRGEGGRAGGLGVPISPPTPMTEGARSGRVVRFEGGAIFIWDPQRDEPRPDPVVLSTDHPAFRRWVQLGAGRSPVGWPLGPVAKTPELGAQVLWCTRGAIFDHPSHGLCAVFGVPFSKWQEQGGLGGALGYPTLDQAVPSDPNGVELASFEHGRIGWSPSRGAWIEPGAA